MNEVFHLSLPQLKIFIMSLTQTSLCYVTLLNIYLNSLLYLKSLGV